MRARARLAWRAATAVAFGATAALAIALSRGAPVNAALASPGTGAASPVSPGLAAGAARCPAAGLRVSLGSGTRLTAVVTRYQLEFTNVSSAPCTLAGYPLVAAYRGDGAQVGPAAAHDTSAVLRRVLLAPGQTAYAALSASAPTLRCGPVRASGFRVVPPGGTTARFIRRPVTTCVARAAHGRDYLLVRAVQPGATAAGGTSAAAGARPSPSVRQSSSPAA